MKMNEYCDNKWQELDRTYPSLILENQNQMSEILKELELKESTDFF